MSEFSHFPPPSPNDRISAMGPNQSALDIVLHEKPVIPEISIELKEVYEHAGEVALTASNIESPTERNRRIFSEGYGIGVGVPEDATPDVPVPVRDKPYIVDASLSAYVGSDERKLGKQQVMIAHGYINEQGEWTLRDGRLVSGVVYHYNEQAKREGMPMISALGICQDSPDQVPKSSDMFDGVTYIAGSNVIVSGARGEEGLEVTLRAQTESGNLIDASKEESELELAASMLSANERDIFAPYEPKNAETGTLDDLVDSLVHTDKYDKLFDKGYDNSNASTQYARSGDSEIMGRETTEESQKFGERMLAQVKDSIVSGIIQQRASELLTPDHTVHDVMKMIREDRQVRYQLAVSLLRKLDNFVENNSSLLPPRVGRRDEVKAPHRRYGKNATMPSRDYVACIALSFIDGSFDPKSTDIEALNQGFDPNVGEHRYTAAGLLTNKWPHASNI